MRWKLLIALALLVLWAKPSSAALIICKTPDSGELGSCSSYVNYDVPATLNVTENAIKAVNWTNVTQYYDFGSSQYTSCPVYHSVKWACSQYFPRCVNNTNVTLNATVRKICDTTCLRGKRWKSGFCKKTAGLSDSYFTTQCGDTEFYVDADTEPCWSPQIAWDFASEDNPLFKWIVFGIMGAIGLAILISIIWVQCRRRACGSAQVHPDAAEQLDRNTKEILRKLDGKEGGYRGGRSNRSNRGSRRSGGDRKRRSRRNTEDTSAHTGTRVEPPPSSFTPVENFSNVAV